MPKQVWYNHWHLPLYTRIYSHLLVGWEILYSPGTYRRGSSSIWPENHTPCQLWQPPGDWSSLPSLLAFPQFFFFKWWLMTVDLVHVNNLRCTVQMRIPVPHVQIYSVRIWGEECSSLFIFNWPGSIFLHTKNTWKHIRSITTVLS